MKRALASALVGALLAACYADKPEPAPVPPVTARDAGSEEVEAGPRDAGVADAATDAAKPQTDAGTDGGTGAFVPGKYEAKGQARCDIGETRLTLNPLTLAPFGANGPVVFTPQAGSPNVATVNDVIIVGNRGVSCTITQSGDTLTVFCTHPTQGTCTELLELDD